MAAELIRALTALTHRLVILSERDDGLRADLRALAAAVLETLDSSPTAITAEPDRPIADGAARERSESLGAIDPIATGTTGTVALESSRRQPPLPELTLGRSRPVEPEARPAPVSTVARGATTDAELPAVEARCRLKAEGLRWASTRRRRIEEGTEFRAEIAPRDREILDRAKDLGCFLWMNTPDFVIPKNHAPLADVAGCFETVADALALVRGLATDIETNRELFEQALYLLAEAQSALRVAIDRIDGPRDPDQFQVYDWLRGVAASEHIYIPRHMRLDDPADPARLPELVGRIEALDARFQKIRRQSRKKKSHLNRLRYHAKLIAEGAGANHDWRKIADAVAEMIGEGTPASSVAIREALLPILDRMPELDDPPGGFGLALREIDRYLATRPTSPGIAAVEAPSAQVAEAARLLAGKGMVLIGGSRRPGALEALKAALGLKELVWVETREHESIDSFESIVARPEIALVLLAIRWSSHSYGEVKQFCDRYGKPMVRLPAGYNPNQVAAQILAQCSGQLASE